jgi:peptidoglycan/LPS O-acetylase OafA/YrhL
LSDDESRRFFDFRLAPFANPPIRVGLADRFSFCPSTLGGMTQQRALPPVQQTAVIAGIVIAATVASILRLATGPTASIFGIAAPLCGIALGAVLAGKMAKYAGLYHGALVGVGYVFIEAIGLAPAPLDPAGDGLAEAVWIIGGDALLLAVAALAGWIAAPQGASSSSSGTGRGR